MISLILYGRNDSYGYNLHKRAALSLNCMSEVLTDPTDEVLFVDYNTPDDYPTFPEAIQDTLTDRAKERIRILRVRPVIHARFAKKTHLVALEPIARNIAGRRSNPANKWLVSTNTDMIFVPRRGDSLSSLVADLPAGFYHLPRFEIPETLWETFDRRDAGKTIDEIRYWSRAAHLNEIVLAAPFNRFDGPGDFQLIARDDLFRINGFDEDMLLGWHVDSNIAKRLNLLHGKTLDVLDRVYGYHCDHTRQVTPAHRRDSVSNDIATFVDNIVRPEKASQADTWGLAGDEIEEIRLGRTRNTVYLEGLKAVIGSEMSEPTTVAYVPETYDKVSYDPPHVLPFLSDIFVNAPAGTRLAWSGGNRDMFALFSALWEKMEIGAPLLVDKALRKQLGGAIRPEDKVVGLDEINEQADALIFDFSTNPGSADADVLQTVRLAFVTLVMREQARLLAGKPPRRFICVNSIHNRFEGLVTSLISIARTPFSSRIRQGFVLPIEPIDCTTTMMVGSAGERSGLGIRSTTLSGHMMYGPYVVLLPGRYMARLKVSTPGTASWLARKLHNGSVAALEIVAADRKFARREVSSGEFAGGSIEISFSVPQEDLGGDGIEIRTWSSGTYQFCVERVEILPMAGD